MFRNTNLLARLGVILLILAVSVAASGWQRGDFLFLEEVQPGMSGICKTVVKGSEISTFSFEVVDVIDSPGQLNDMILIRAWGDAITESGGIAAGMSGSPCYVDDKLIGGIFAVYAEAGFSDVSLVEEQPHALVQPVENMLEVLDACNQRVGAKMIAGNPVRDQFLSPGIEISVTSKSGLINRIKVVAKRPSLKELRNNPRTLFVRRLATPVMVNGLSERAFSWMKSGVGGRVIEENERSLLYIRGEEVIDRFSRFMSQGLEEQYGLQLYRMGAVQRQPGADPGQLEPGSPIGAALMLGDVTAGAFGTITYVENQCLVAFGHYFLTGGQTILPMTTVSIIDTIRSVRSPFKIGFIGDEIGSILEDRMQGIGGAIGIQAKTIQFNFTVTDKDRGKTQQFKVKSVTLPELHPGNVLLAGIEAVDQTLNRVGPGTLNLHFTIKGAGMPRALERSDVFVSESDVAVTGPLQVSLIDFLLAWNEFADPQIDEINVEMEIEQALRTMVIESIEPLADEVEAEDELCYAVTLQPYRQPQQVVEDCIRIPYWVAGDAVRLEAFPARDLVWKFEYEEPWVRPYMPPILNFNDLFRAIKGAPSNDLMVVTVYSAPYGPAAIYTYKMTSVGDWVVSGDQRSRNRVIVR